MMFRCLFVLAYGLNDGEGQGAKQDLFAFSGAPLLTTQRIRTTVLGRETYMQVRKQQLELDMEQQTGSK